ncbi:MAG: glycine betaine/L-proline ABC transporter substrate-binding protein ProX [Gammaproteobacteria bacterium]|nr:glycine betaine/L-proline ABC transporter substrate-binding protein ProX [Gammaproteobacteria bacterium]MDH3465128.1 glycine betaine/L-proline ABC transporter substrate-binding protein ProX [Gammaproteobacteria bacterium]
MNLSKLVGFTLAGTTMMVAGGIGTTAQASCEVGAGTTVRPVEGTNLEEKFQHLVVYRGLEKMGYTVGDPQEVEYQTIHLALGTGDGDFTAVHWDPLHKAFFDESGGEGAMTKVGNLVEGALQGYLVDKASYDAGITNLGDLKDPANAKRFDADGDGKADLAGCVPGWGCERVIEHHMTEYGLRDTVTHNQGAYNAIIADTIARKEGDKPVLYYTWTPYWVSGVLVPGDNVEWIAVPYSSLPDGRKANTSFDGKDLGFEVNSLRVVANNKFLDANPGARKFFEMAKININDVSAQNNRMQAGEDSMKDVEKFTDDWISANQAEFDSWVKAGCEAGS